MSHPNVRPNVRYVIGPDGRPLTHADLPCVKTRRWVSGRKAQVVQAVRAGLITMAEACDRYRLSEEEYLSWQAAVERSGEAGLLNAGLRQARLAASAH